MDSAPEWMSLRAYARRRGVRLSAVQKAIESRRVTAIREEGDRVTGIDPIKADEQWSAHTDPVEAERNGKLQAVAAALQPNASTAPSAVEKTSPSSANSDQSDFLSARVKEADLRGQLLELDKLERIAMLLPRSAVQREISEIFAQLKNAALRIADRKAQTLAGETDPLRVHRILSDEIRTVFDECSRQLSGSAAGMADDVALVGERETVLS